MKAVLITVVVLTPWTALALITVALLRRAARRQRDDARLARRYSEDA